MSRMKPRFLPCLLMLITVLSCAVFSVPAMAKTRISEKQISLLATQSKKLKIKGVSSKKVTWHSSNPKVASIRPNGKVTGRLPGTAVIKATVRKKGKRKNLFCRITVLPNTEALRSNTFRCIAHRGYSAVSRTGNNLLSSFHNAADHGFNYAECDIMVTSDGYFVCSHDILFTDGRSGKTMIIREHTLDELRQCLYYGGRIATLEEVLHVCSQRGLGLYLDKIHGLRTPDEWQRLFRLVEQCGMKRQVSWLIRDQRDGEIVLGWDSAADLVLVATSKERLDNAVPIANALKTSANQFHIDVEMSLFTPQWYKSALSQLVPGVTFEVYSVNGKATYLKYLPYVTGITSDKLCLNDIN